MPFIPETKVDTPSKGNIEDGLPNLLDPLATSSPPKPSQVLLPPFAPVVFIEAKESSLSSDLETNKYEPINVPNSRDSLVNPASDNQQNGKTLSLKLEVTSTTDACVESTIVEDLDNFKLSYKWLPVLRKRIRGGLENLGNSCFMNSTLQVLMHTAPLVNILCTNHPKAEDCPLKETEGFCFACSLRSLIFEMWSSKGRAKSPSNIYDHMRKIAPSFRRGRQEDAHEFLRFSIDALQLGAQKGVKEVPEKLAETSWVYRLFGGKFRSRVNCSECNHNSDTFDTLLDLSVDVGRCDTLHQALRKFASVEKLEGKNKYKCEKCNKPVNASKQITVHTAPQALCIQLKRFTPWGRKLTHQVAYPNVLSLNDAMSKDQSSPMYRLYGIVCHAGGTPNSGHYYSYVKTPEDTWARMNDEDNLGLSGAPPYDHKNAYMLFYMRESSMLATIAEATISHNKPPVTLLSGQKRKREDRIFDSSPQEDLGEVLANQRTTSPFRDLSPSLSNVSPSPAKRPRYETYSGIVPIVNLAKNPTVKSKFKFTDPHKSIPTLQPNPRPKLPQKPLSTFKDLGLSYASSEAEDPEEPPLPVPSSQTDVASETQPSSLPVSREGTPEYTAPYTQRAWQKADSSASSVRTPYESPPSSADSRKRKNREADENAVARGSKLKRQKSEEDIPAWVNGWDADGASQNVSKKYKSNAKKERRERRGNHNPYGMMGIPAADRVQFGAKKHKRPSAL